MASIERHTCSPTSLLLTLILCLPLFLPHSRHLSFSRSLEDCTVFTQFFFDFPLWADFRQNEHLQYRVSQSGWESVFSLRTTTYSTKGSWCIFIASQHIFSSLLFTVLYFPSATQQPFSLKATRDPLQTICLWSYCSCVSWHAQSLTHCFSNWRILSLYPKAADLLAYC